MHGQHSGSGHACYAPHRDTVATGVTRSSRTADGSVTASPTADRTMTITRGRKHRIEQCQVPATEIRMGDHHDDGAASDGEAPVHTVRVGAFTVDATCVTNNDFAMFVAATGYVTDAERYGFSALFHLALGAPVSDVIGRFPHAPWWLGVRDADWAHPFGRDSDLSRLGDHPAVHISHADAQAYCHWAGRRLPTEAEWEVAARGGLHGERYPWGSDLEPTRGWPCNIWQGHFPTHNTGADGYFATAPVRTYAPNSYGLWQVVGNVWEWCADWFDPAYYRTSPRDDPAGPDTGNTRVLRGGSYLCHPSYCNRYRVAARFGNTPDSSMGNAGFRTVANV